MKIIYNTEKYHKKIKKSIKKYGHCAEHNYTNYQCMQNCKHKNIAFDFGKGRMLLASVDSNNNYRIFPNGALTNKNERVSLVMDFLRHAIIKKRVAKVVVETSEGLRKEIVKKLKSHKKYKARRASILYWPVYNLSKWDVKLKGKKWKKLRNIKNRFYKKYRIRAVKSNIVKKEKLKQILDSWLKRRNNRDRANKDYYLNIIDNSFKGFDFTRTLIINGKPCTITGGWKIPNSRGYYSSIGIFDYSHKYLSDIANIDDLNNLKRSKIKYVDFGGSDKKLLAFKKKFKPDKIYKTYIFSIVRR